LSLLCILRSQNGGAEGRVAVEPKSLALAGFTAISSHRRNFFALAFQIRIITSESGNFDSLTIFYPL
jgi:hypothetical protein